MAQTMMRIAATLDNNGALGWRHKASWCPSTTTKLDNQNTFSTLFSLPSSYVMSRCASTLQTPSTINLICKETHPFQNEWYDRTQKSRTRIKVLNGHLGCHDVKIRNSIRNHQKQRKMCYIKSNICVLVTRPKEKPAECRPLQKPGDFSQKPIRSYLRAWSEHVVVKPRPHERS
jgi:hypothetical protein